MPKLKQFGVLEEGDEQASARRYLDPIGLQLDDVNLTFMVEAYKDLLLVAVDLTLAFLEKFGGHVGMTFASVERYLGHGYLRSEIEALGYDTKPLSDRDLELCFNAMAQLLLTQVPRLEAYYEATHPREGHPTSEA